MKNFTDIKESITLSKKLKKSSEMEDLNPEEFSDSPIIDSPENTLTTPQHLVGGSIITEEEKEHLLRAPARANNSVARRSILMTKMNEEDLYSTNPERNPHHLSHADTEKLGPWFLRGFPNFAKLKCFTTLAKLNAHEEDENKAVSQFLIPLEEHDNLANILEDLATQCLNLRAGEWPTLLGSSKHKNITEYKDVTRYWSKQHTTFTESGRFGVRQKKENDGFSLQIFQPSNDSRWIREDWIGCSATMQIGHAFGISKILRRNYNTFKNFDFSSKKNNTSSETEWDCDC